MRKHAINSTLATRLLGALLLATVLFAGFTQPVTAQHRPGNDGNFSHPLNKLRQVNLQLASLPLDGLQLADKGNAGISAAQAGNIAKSKYGGKVLKITPIQSGNGTDYRVRLLLDSGKVINVMVDGKTGRVR